MKDKITLLLCLTVCFTLIISGILFWPTLYRYDKTTRDMMIVRINRITGYTEVLILSSGWNTLRRTNEVRAIPHKEMVKITNYGFANGKSGDYEFGVYNGSEWTIKKIRLLITAKDKRGKIRLQKIYEASVDVSPFSAGKGSVKLFAAFFYHLNAKELPEGDLSEYSDIEVINLIGKYEVKLEEAFGYKGE